jgi:hypothetical protein
MPVIKLDRSRSWQRPAPAPEKYAQRVAHTFDDTRPDSPSQQHISINGDQDQISFCVIIITFCWNIFFGGGRSRDSIVGIATGRPRDRSSSPGRVENFLFSASSRPALGPTQPPSQWVPGALSPGVKWSGCEADHSAKTSAKVKKMWIYTSAPHTRLHGVVLN